MQEEKIKATYRGANTLLGAGIAHDRSGQGAMGTAEPSQPLVIPLAIKHLTQLLDKASSAEARIGSLGMRLFGQETLHPETAQAAPPPPGVMSELAERIEDLDRTLNRIHNNITALERLT